MRLRRLDPVTDRAAVESVFARATDYVDLERGPTPAAESARDYFEGDLPPGVDLARSLHLGVEGPKGLDGLVEVVFGFPEPDDAYVGLLLLAPGLRGRGFGGSALREIEALARERGATRLLAAVLDANPRGRAFWLREGFVEVARFEGRPHGIRTHDVARLAKAL